jgi:phenylpropionate dioxygenase-like ring-hydroxylating dioxygenase large terminal subunit
MTLSASDFVSPARWDNEQRSTFNASWIAVCRSEDVVEPNSYVSAFIGLEPVVVTRSADGSLCALSNVCRHRGTTVVEGSGSARALTCPNHLWTYGLDGALRAAPSMTSSESREVPHGSGGFDVSSICLPQFAVCEWQGWVLINIDGAATHVSESLAHLDTLLAPYNLASMSRVGKVEFPSPWNWKVSVENFSESYHHQSIHPQTLQVTFPGAQSFVLPNQGEPWSWLDHVSVDPAQEPFTATVVFPTLMFSLVRPIGMFWFHLEPKSAAETLLTIEAFVIPALAGEPGIGEALIDTVTAINCEDIGVNQRTFAGLSSQFAELGQLSHLEAGLAMFRTWIGDCYEQSSK